MKVTLAPRTAENVAIYFDKAKQPAIRRLLPQRAQTLADALADYEKSQMPGTTSYGRSIYADGRYVGDVWIYAIDPAEIPNAMLSYCVFEVDWWGRGIATAAVQVFLAEVMEKFDLKTIGAFAYAENAASLRVLEKNGFNLMAEFEEDGVASRYYQLT